MRSRKALIPAIVVVAGLILTISMWRTSPALVALSVSRVEAMGPGEWMVTVAITNLTSTALDFDVFNTKVSARLAEHWVEVERPGSVSYLGREKGGEFAFLVPCGTQVCRVSLECSPESVSDKVERFFRYSPLCRPFLKTSRWAADHTVKPHRHPVAEITLPKTPNYAPPKLDEAHNPGSAENAGFALLSYRSPQSRRA